MDKSEWWEDGEEIFNLKRDLKKVSKRKKKIEKQKKQISKRVRGNKNSRHEDDSKMAKVEESSYSSYIDNGE